jgi:hypothetical protein
MVQWVGLLETQDHYRPGSSTPPPPHTDISVNDSILRSKIYQGEIFKFQIEDTCNGLSREIFYLFLLSSSVKSVLSFWLLMPMCIIKALKRFLCTFPFCLIFLKAAGVAFESCWKLYVNADTSGFQKPVQVATGSFWNAFCDGTRSFQYN